MNGDANLPHRSSSPLKRRASSMDPEEDNNKSAGANTSTTGAETGPTIVARAMSVDMPDADGAAAGSDSTSPKPSLTEQVKVIETLLQAFREAPVKDGDKAYLVSRSWVDKALALRSGNGKNNDDADDATLGPIDNSDIIEEQSTDSSNQSFTRLKPGSGLEEFELFPEDAWNMVMDWYGIKQGQQPIVRTAIESASNELGESNVLYEFHPTIFKAHRLWSEISPLPIEQSLKARNPPPLRLVRSRKYHAQTLVKELKELSGIPLERRIRLWTVPEILPAADESRPRSALTPPDSPGREDGADNSQAAWPNLLIDLPSFKELGSQKEKLPLQDQTVNPNYNGRSTLQQNGLVTDQTLVLEEHIEKTEWVSTYIGRTRGPERSLVARGAGNGPSSRTASGRNSPTPSGPNTRGRVKSRHGRSLGAVGLHNLGNTCYMNSALQCVRSVEELTKYFLTDTYVDEVNKTNPLGYHGKVALAYVGLLRDIYAEGRGSVSPRDFKNMVGRCRSTFAGWGQQDSQEFLGFLLDALQEDLSRIVKKPYIEKPDSTDDMINDPEAIRQMAEQVWDITRKRDDSVIADLFTGMYKSTLKCPECGKISITFDPFNNLTLPLPIENMWTRPVKFFPLNDAPVLIDVELPKHSAIDALRQFISERTGVPVDRLIGAEEYNNTFFKVYDINQDVSEEIRNSDVPTVHELEATPTNWPVKGRKPKIRSMLDVDAPFDADDADDPRYEKMVVPVFHRRPDAETRQAGASPPHFIVLSRAEASDYVAIRRKVLEKVATFSTWTKFNDVPGSESAETGDSDAVVMTASDADSSGESKVAARSVEGEDDMLDISMQNGSGASKEQKIGDKVLKHFNRRRPACARTEQALDPELSQLFDLSYFHEHNNGSIPTGWQKLNYGGSLPKVSDRIPESSTEDGDDDGEGASPASWNSTASGNEDSSGEDASKEEEPVATRMNDESSEDDMPKGAKFARRPAQMKGSRKKFKDHKAYGKKGNKRRDKVMRNKKEAQRMGPVKPQPTPPAVADGGPLIRLDEGLVVDWKEDAWEAVFGSSSKTPDSFQGAPTFVDLETLHDPALKQNQRRRQTRRSRGITLEECLDEFERAEVLSEQDMWYCPRCKEHRRASKKFDLWKTPDILVAHLKRFSSSGYRRDKLDVLVDFPVEGLDLTSRVIQKEDGQDEIYDLIAVDDHYGGLGGGHYTAYARNFADGEWYNYNDSSVSKVKDTSSVVTSAAYLLFYRRRSNKPLGGPRFAKIIEQFNQTDDESEDELANSGEVQRLGGRSSPAGSLRQGQGAAAVIRPRPDRHETTTTVRALDGSDDEDLPSYSEPSGGDVIHNSIEADEGIDMADPGQPLSFNALQAWNFEGLNSGAGTPDNDYASDTAQADMSVDDHDMDGQTGVDTEMDVGVTNDAFDDTAERRATDTNASGPRDEKEVLTVPSAERSEASSDVAEIRLDSDKNV